MGFMFAVPFSRVACAVVAGLRLYPTRKPDRLKTFFPRDDGTSEHGKAKKSKGHLPQQKAHVRMNKRVCFEDDKPR